MHAGRMVYRRSARQRVRTRYRRRISYKRRRARTFRRSARCYIRDEQHGSYFVAGAGEWTCFNSKFSFAEFPYQLRARWYDNFDQVKVLSVTYKIWIRDVSPDQLVSRGDALVPVMRVPEFRWSYDPELSKNIFTCCVVYASYI